MKLKELTDSISKEDILKFLDYQDDVKIKSIDIHDNISVVGEYEFKKKSLTFSIVLELGNVLGTIVELKVTEFSLLNHELPALVKGLALKYLINSFELEGLKFKDDVISINVIEMFNDLHINGINIDDFSINYVEFNDDNELEISIKNVYIDPSIFEDGHEDVSEKKNA